MFRNHTAKTHEKRDWQGLQAATARLRRSSTLSSTSQCLRPTPRSRLTVRGPACSATWHTLQETGKRTTNTYSPPVPLSASLPLPLSLLQTSLQTSPQTYKPTNLHPPPNPPSLTQQVPSGHGKSKHRRHGKRQIATMKKRHENACNRCGLASTEASPGNICQQCRSGEQAVSNCLNTWRGTKQ